MALKKFTAPQPKPHTDVVGGVHIALVADLDDPHTWVVQVEDPQTRDEGGFDGDYVDLYQGPRATALVVYNACRRHMAAYTGAADDLCVMRAYWDGNKVVIEGAA